MITVNRLNKIFLVNFLCLGVRKAKSFNHIVNEAN